MVTGQEHWIPQLIIRGVTSIKKKSKLQKLQTYNGGDLDSELLSIFLFSRRFLASLWKRNDVLYILLASRAPL